MVKQFQSYSDPEEPTITTSSEEEGVVLPLGDTTLTCNLGLPLVVVCCKVKPRACKFSTKIFWETPLYLQKYLNSVREGTQILSKINYCPANLVVTLIQLLIL